jgi:hypothetical protein
MDIYGLNPTGKIYIEKVQKKDAWSSLSIGRLILEIETGNAYLGSTDGIYGDAGWILIGLFDNVVKASNISWNFDMHEYEDKVSALSIPCKYNTTITDIQSAITDIECNLNNLIFNPISFIPPGIINYLHFDTTSAIGVTAKRIPIEDCNDLFLSTNIEDALLERLTSAELIMVPADTEFGTLLKFNVNNMENALINIEQYLYTLNATNIFTNYDTTTITVQHAFDNILQYYLPSFLNFKDRICLDSQTLISQDGKFDCSNMEDHINIMSYSGTIQNIQISYNELCVEINTIKSMVAENQRLFENILGEIGSIYCILEKCVSCDIWNIDCYAVGH